MAMIMTMSSVTMVDWGRLVMERLFSIHSLNRLQSSQTIKQRAMICNDSLTEKKKTPYLRGLALSALNARPVNPLQ
jgi:hypothetical protein